MRLEYQKPRALLFIDYPNLVKCAKEWGGDFNITSYIKMLRGIYSLSRENIHIFLNRSHLGTPLNNTGRALLKSAHVHISTAIRKKSPGTSISIDPVDLKMERHIRQGVYQHSIDVLLIGSSDKAFSVFGEIARRNNKWVHVYPYINPSAKYFRDPTTIVHPVYKMLTS